MRQVYGPDLKDDRLTTPEQIEAMKKELALARLRGRTGAINKKTVMKWTSNFLFTVVILVLLFLIMQVLTAKREGTAPNLFGYYIFYIETDSMYPTYPAGSFIISKKPDNPSNLKEDDVITFYSTDGDRITHRIVDVTVDDSGKLIYKTKGDNPANSIDREPVTPDRVEAVLVAGF